MPGKENPGKKSLFQQQSDSRAISLALKLSTVSFQALKHISTIHETPDSLLAIRFQSCIAWSPAYCLNRLAFLVAIIPLYCVTYAMQPV